jgi:excisionase family DNA binding protein
VLLVTAREAAKLLGISERHFRKLVASGGAPRPVRLGRSVRWNVDELRAWTAAGSPSRERWEVMRDSGGQK